MGLRPNDKKKLKLIAGVVISVMFIAPSLTAFLYPSSVTGFASETKNEKEKAEGGFFKYNNIPVFNGSKLVVWFFGVPNCYECEWQRPIIEYAAQQFENVELRVYDNPQNQTITQEDIGILFKHSPEGTMPTIIIGDVYSRVGESLSLGETEEAEYITSMICDIIYEPHCNKL